MSEQDRDHDPVPDTDTVVLAAEVARDVEHFLGALQAVATEASGGQAVSLLLLEVSRISLTGARLGAHQDFMPAQEFQPDVGPEADLEPLRMRLAQLLGPVDTYSFVFDPYVPETVVSQLSDDLVSIASDLENGLRHHRNGNLREALWWWQFSYLSSWGNLAGAALNAFLAIGTHDRLDAESELDAEQVAAAGEMLRESGEEPR